MGPLQQQRPGIKAFFKPAGPSKPAARRQASPPGLDCASAAAAGEHAAPPAMQQFARKRKRVSSSEAAETVPAEPPADAAEAPPAAPAGATAQLASAGTGEGAAAAAGPKQQPRQLTQMYLDVGQRDFHSYRCPTCGMLYARGTDADDRLHAAFHASATQGPRYQGWQGERVAQVDGSRGRVLLFSTSAHQGRGRKALQELCGFLEEQMGLASGWLQQVPCTLLLYVSSARRIQACVLAEAIKGAFPVHPCLPPSSAAAAQGMRSCGSAAEGAAPAEGDAAAAAAPQSAAGAFLAAVVAQVATSGRSLLSVTLSSGAATAECGGNSSSSAAAPGGSGGGGPAAVQGGEQQQQPMTPAAEGQQQQQAPPPPPIQQQQQPLHLQPVTDAAGVALALDRRQRVRAVCGVRLMWVSVEARRRGLASRLLDCCRCQFMPGYVLPRHELAFSAPTDAGRAFIEAYAGTRRFLVYE